VHELGLRLQIRDFRPAIRVFAPHTVGELELQTIPQAVEKVVGWRLEELMRAGYDRDAAMRLAAHIDVDLHVAVDLCEPGLSAKDGSSRPAVDAALAADQVPLSAFRRLGNVEASEEWGLLRGRGMSEPAF
jgi:hypothetical protein